MDTRHQLRFNVFRRTESRDFVVVGSLVSSIPPLPPPEFVRQTTSGVTGDCPCAMMLSQHEHQQNQVEGTDARYHVASVGSPRTHISTALISTTPEMKETHTLVPNHALRRAREATAVGVQGVSIGAK